jgi:DNA repair protein RadC
MQDRLKMKDMPISERPYEKLEKFGSEMLSNAELLAIIIKTGSRNETSVMLAQKLLTCGDDEKGLAFLHDISLEELKAIKGIGRVKAIQIKALAEVSKRMASSFGMGNRVTIKSPEDVARLLMEEMRHLKKEVFKIILLNTKNCLMKHVSISIGSLNASIVHPREVFTEAVKTGCSGVLMVHNHPSGDPTPSSQDIETTKRLQQVGEIVGIKLIDHLVIGDGTFISLKEEGYM